MDDGRGRLQWRELVAPAASLGTNGFPIYRYLANYYSLEGPSRPGYPGIVRKLQMDSLARRIYLPNGKPPECGASLRQLRYGATLERLGNSAPADFYTGAIAQLMAGDLEAHGAAVTADDLAGYRARLERPVSMGYREYQIYSAPPPSHGLILLTMLALAETSGLVGLSRAEPDYVELLAAVIRTAFAEVLPYLGDPKFVTVPSEWLLSRERVASVRLFASSPSLPNRVLAGTSHVSAADRSGQFISVTHTIGSIAGAGVMSEELGFLYNNFVGQANPLRGHHDSIVPGKRLGGGCPTIVHRGGRPWLAIGSSGGPRLFSAIFQTLLNLMVHNMTLDEAIAAPRIHCEEAGRIYVEPALSPDTQVELQHRGYEVVPTTYMGCNQAVALEQGELVYGSDPRGGGGVAAV